MHHQPSHERYDSPAPTTETEMNPMFLSKQRIKLTKAKSSSVPEDVKETSFFDTIAIQFHFSTFLYQFMCHLILPLLFFVPNPKGQGIRWELAAFCSTILIPTCVYLMIICYFCSSQSDQNLTGGSLWIPIMYFISHRLILSLKYGSLSPTEYKRFNACKNVELSKNYIIQMQIITGWTFIDQAVLHFELGAAAARIGVKINEIYIRIPSVAQETIEEEEEVAKCTHSSQVRYWNAFVRGHELIDWDSKPAPELKKLPDGSYAISVYDVLLAVLRKCTADKVDPMVPYVQYLVIFIAVIIIIISYVPVFQKWDEVDSIPLMIVFLIASTQVNWLCGRVFYFILYTAIVDVKRMLRVFRTLHYMIRLSDLMMDASISILRSQHVSYCDEQMASIRADTIFSMGDYNEESLQRLIPGPKEAAKKDKEDEEVSEGRETEVLGEYHARNHGYALIPRISFHYPQNIIAWTYCRVTMQHFGDRFRARIDSYVGKTILFLKVVKVDYNFIVFFDSWDVFGGSSDHAYLDFKYRISHESKGCL